MSWNTYIALSLVMFFEYAVWGAWFPVLASRLLGPLKMSAKQTGWIYTTLPVACIVSPLVGGQLADKYWNLEWILIVAHLIAAVLMFVAARQKSFTGLLLTMFGWSLCYGATLPLVNSVLFQNAASSVVPKVFIWAPVGWALVGYSLSGWRMLRKSESDGSDALNYCAVLGLVMAGCCLLLPATPPKSQQSFVDAMQMLRQGDFLLFLVTSMFVFGTVQFYFLGSGRFLMDRGISSKAMPGAMAMAQATQTIATLAVFGLAETSLGYKWTVTLGAGCWALLYVIYLAPVPRGILVAAQGLHGLAYVMFIIMGVAYGDKIAPEGLSGSMQGLLFAATSGVGLLLGTPLAGFVMDKYAVESKFQWRKIWAVPLAISLAGTLILATAFQGKVPAKPVEKAVAAEGK